VAFTALPVPGGPYSAYLVVTKSGFPPARSATKTGP
jgi:hypothetical protein